MERYYSGVGARKTPPVVQEDMRRIAKSLRDQGFILRSGGADGADRAFEAGAGPAKEIYVPWDGFNDSRDGAVPPDMQGAMELAARHHPGWRNCSPAARAIHARNVCIVLGGDLATPSAFLLCWTADCRASGGTGQAVRVARAYGVPVIFL